jgi:transcriptional regulator with XRE-family HTH domain
MHKTIYTRQYSCLLTLLREARETAGITQSALAEMLGMKQSDVSKSEQGVRRLDVIELKLWAEALGSTLPKLVTALESRVKSEHAIGKRQPHREMSDK